MLNFLSESFLLGLQNLHLHKLRSLLTALGIIIGVAAVIVMVAIGEGAKRAALEQLKFLGAQNIVIRSAPPPQSDLATARTQRILEYGIKRTDLKRLEDLPGVRVMASLRSTEQKVTRGERRASANAIGATPEIFTLIKLQLDRGRNFTQQEYEDFEDVCVIGSRVAEQLFPYTDPMGQTVQIGTSGMATCLVTIVGVLQPTGLRPDSAAGSNMIDRNLDEDVYFPLTLAQRVFGDSIVKRQAGSMETKKVEISEIWIGTDSIEAVEPLAASVQYIMDLQHANIGDVQVKMPIQILRQAEQQNRMFNLIMVLLAGMSLVVGGIGIMNIMLATVTERTREVGVRRALGAKRWHIVLQFLIETTVISLAGGVLGVCAGIGFSAVFNWVARWLKITGYSTEVTLWSVLVSFVVAGLTGIGFGLYPAVIAARKNPIEALRHE